ncbi:MAG: OmpA family protein [Phocaeicola sp.]
MKSKLIAFSMLLAGASMATAQEQYYTEKWTNNMFMGVNVGGMSVINSGFNAPTLNVGISLGKHLTPTWAIRGQVNGIWTSLDVENSTTGSEIDKKKFIEFNADAMVNLINLFGGYKPGRVFDLYAFGGPTVAASKTMTADADGDRPVRFHVGASAGLGMGFNLSSKWAINMEGRFTVTPSTFLSGSDRMRVEGRGVASIGATYTFGGKKFAKVSDRVIETEVIREVVREVPVEVVREVVKEVAAAPVEMAVFFKINRAVISQEGLVNVKLMAKAMKATPNKVYKVAGFADNATGSATTNQNLSDRRAQAVYDALIAEGVPASQLEKVAMGGADNMFGKNFLNRVVIMEAK